MIAADAEKLHEVSVVVRICPTTIAESNKNGNGKQTTSTRRRSSTTGVKQDRKRADSTSIMDGTVIVSNETSLTLTRGGPTGAIEYSFNKIYTTEASQEEVFYGSVQQCIIDVIHGHNVTVLVTGAIGAGKTYTMMGPEYIQRSRAVLRRASDTSSRSPEKVISLSESHETDGIIPRALHHIYNNITNTLRSDRSADFFIELSFVELGNHGFKDLLEDYRQQKSHPRTRSNTTPAISEDLTDGGMTLSMASAESLINSRRSMITPTGGDSTIGGFSSFRISNETPIRSSSTPVFDFHAYSSTSYDDVDELQPSKSFNMKGAVKTSRDPHMVKDVIDVHESPELGVFLSRPGGNVRIPAASEVEALEMLAAGCKARTSRVIGAEGHLSSRRHAIFTLHIERRTMHRKENSSVAVERTNESVETDRPTLLEEEGDDVMFQCSELLMGKLHMVDLAGIDRLDMSGATGDALTETKYINSSLNSLGEVLRALSKQASLPNNSKNNKKKKNRGSASERKPSTTAVHVPYLDSKLTHLLKDSLGGNCRTLLIAAIHESSDYIGLTGSTLKYAAWAKNMKAINIVANKIDLSKNITETNDEIRKFKESLTRRSARIEKHRSKKFVEGLDLEELRKLVGGEEPMSTGEISINGHNDNGVELNKEIDGDKEDENISPSKPPIRRSVAVRRSRSHVAVNNSEDHADDCGELSSDPIKSKELPDSAHQEAEVAGNPASTTQTDDGMEIKASHDVDSLKRTDDTTNANSNANQGLNTRAQNDVVATSNTEAMMKINCDASDANKMIKTEAPDVIGVDKRTNNISSQHTIQRPESLNNRPTTNQSKFVSNNIETKSITQTNSDSNLSGHTEMIAAAAPINISRTHHAETSETGNNATDTNSSSVTRSAGSSFSGISNRLEEEKVQTGSQGNQRERYSSLGLLSDHSKGGSCCCDCCWNYFFRFCCPMKRKTPLSDLADTTN